MLSRVSSALLALMLVSTAARAGSADDARAVALFQQAEKEFAAHEFANAALHLREAHALKPKPILLYNLGLACAAMGDAKCALDAHRRYLPDAPADQVEKVKLKITELEAMEKARAEADDAAIKAKEAAEVASQKAAIASRKLDEARSAAATEIALARRPPPSPLPWILAGAGVLGLGAGAALGLGARSQHEAAVGALHEDEAASAQNKARALATGANAAFIAGGVMTGVGVVWGIIDVRRSGSPAQSAELRLGPARVAIAGRF